MYVYKINWIIPSVSMEEKITHTALVDTLLWLGINCTNQSTISISVYWCVKLLFHGIDVYKMSRLKYFFLSKCINKTILEKLKDKYRHALPGGFWLIHW